MVLAFLMVTFFIHDSFADMDEVNDANDEAVASDFDGGMRGAFQRDGGFGDAGDGNLFRWKGGEIVEVEFVFAVREGGGGGDHDLAQRFIDHVDHEFAGFPDVAGGVFGGVVVLVSGREGDDGGI